MTKKTAATASDTGVVINSPTDRGQGLETSVIAADGDTPGAEPGTEDRTEAGEAREGNTAPAAAVTTASSLDTSAPADIAPATEFEPSGAPVQVVGVDFDHPAVDANPRANTTVDQNRIDFNDPVKTGEQVVTERLAEQAS